MWTLRKCSYWTCDRYYDGGTTKEGRLCIVGNLKSHNIDNNKNSMDFFKMVNTLFVKSARTKKFDNEIDLIFVNEGLESLGYI